jgi:predicted DNA-binding transcriptional regulator AlpA
VTTATDGYLPLKALAQYSGLSVRTLRSYLASPSHPLPCFRIGGKIVVKRSEYDRWVNQFRIASTDGIDALVAETLRGL